MKIERPYEIVITTERGLNIILISIQKNSVRSYSHFMGADDAERFADTLETVLANGTYAKIDRCPICGQPFTRQDNLCLLADDRPAHLKCYRRALRERVLECADCKSYQCKCFPADLPAFDFSNLQDDGRKTRFRYAIQTVSKTVIHIYAIDFCSNIKRHFCLTYDECVGLIRMIREKLEKLRAAVVGTCAFCGSPVYLDQTRYEMADGKLVHRRCMEQFISSEKSKGAAFPAKCVPLTDVFGHARLFRKYHDPNPFTFGL